MVIASGFQYFEASRAFRASPSRGCGHRNDARDRLAALKGRTNRLEGYALFATLVIPSAAAPKK
jgi:hypothetical protein